MVSGLFARMESSNNYCVLFNIPHLTSDIWRKGLRYMSGKVRSFEWKPRSTTQRGVDLGFHEKDLTLTRMFLRNPFSRFTSLVCDILYAQLSCCYDDSSSVSKSQTVISKARYHCPESEIWSGAWYLGQISRCGNYLMYLFQISLLLVPHHGI